MLTILTKHRMHALVLGVFVAAFLTAPPVMNIPHAQSAEIPIPKAKPKLKKAPVSNARDIPVPKAKPKEKSLKPQTKKKTTKASYKLPKARAIELSNKALSNKNVKLYTEIFDLQSRGDMKEAAEKIEKLSDHRLYGYVLHQRYTHPAGYKASFEELQRWLTHYADQPRAEKIYQLALQARANNAKSTLRKPKKRPYIARRREPTMVHAAQYKSSRDRNGDEAAKLNALRRDVRTLVHDERPTQAIDLIETDEYRKNFDNAEHDMLRARIAASYLYNGKVTQALRHASQSVNRSGQKVPLAGWVAGIASWMKEDYAAAAKYFAVTGRSDYASGWTKSAGAYWAARAHMRMGNVKEVNAWLGRAAAYPRTFYGLIATRAMGRDFDFHWKIPTFTKDNYKQLAATPAGFRAMALVDVGQNIWAESELLRMDIADKTFRDALLSYADYAKIPGLTMRLGSAVSSGKDGVYYDAALYPAVPWQPQSGYKIEPALIHAIMRQESRFNPIAASTSGARGLMQIIPSTARSVGLKKTSDLESPEANLELGQRYLAKLLKEKSVNRDVFKLLIAYNGGPGNLRKWSSRWPNVKDPLLFVELLPSAETRAYVERVMANYWIYHMREDESIPTLNAVISGKPVKYPSNENSRLETALAN